MRRLPFAAFVVLAALSVGAFFLIQHWKVEDPLVWGDPYPAPSTFDPVGGSTCKDAAGQQVDYRTTGVGFELADQGDSVAVRVLAGSSSGPVVATLATDTPMARNQFKRFTWNGRRADGKLAAPGDYVFQIKLQRQGRTINVVTPAQLITSAHPANGGCFPHATKQ